MELGIKEFVIVGFAGALGAISRFLILQFSNSTESLKIFVINTFGCFLIGSFSSFLATPQTRLFLITGFLGSFTTFSTFGLLSLEQIKALPLALGVFKIFLQVFVGIFFCYLGQKVVST